ncbi:hypothetical protein Hanom_Chr12g01161981 [Helianthus anomalus]
MEQVFYNQIYKKNKLFTEVPSCFVFLNYHRRSRRSEPFTFAGRFTRTAIRSEPSSSLIGTVGILVRRKHFYGSRRSLGSGSLSKFSVYFTLSLSLVVL